MPSKSCAAPATVNRHAKHAHGLFSPCNHCDEREGVSSGQAQCVLTICEPGYRPAEDTKAQREGLRLGLRSPFFASASWRAISLLFLQLASG